MENCIEAETYTQRLELTVGRFKQAQHQFTDEKSRKQIDVYLIYANDTQARNQSNLRRWYDHLAWRWYEIN